MVCDPFNHGSGQMYDFEVLGQKGARGLILLDALGHEEPNGLFMRCHRAQKGHEA